MPGHLFFSVNLRKLASVCSICSLYFSSESLGTILGNSNDWSLG